MRLRRSFENGQGKNMKQIRSTFMLFAQSVLKRTGWHCQPAQSKPGSRSRRNARMTSMLPGLRGSSFLRGTSCCARRPAVSTRRTMGSKRMAVSRTLSQQRDRHGRPGDDVSCRRPEQQFRDRHTRAQTEAASARRRSVRTSDSGHVKSIEIHHLVPRSHEVAHELLPCVVARVHLGKRTEL